MDRFNYKEWTSMQEVFSKMSLRDANRYFRSVWQEGFDAAKRKYGLNHAEVYTWDDRDLWNLLRRNHICKELADKIISQLEEESHDEQRKRSV